jgi:Ca2+-binding RTX toxin-like protein
LMVALSFSTQALAGPVICQGERATIVGTKRSEVLEGTSGRDVIAGRGGGDAIAGGGGNDVICGQGGRDTLSGGEGNDRITGGPGSDFFSGGPGDDTLDGGSDADSDKGWDDVLSFASSEQGVTVDAPARTGSAEGEGSDTLVGYFEIIEGSEFDDGIDGSVSEFELRGLGGNDHLIGGSPYVTLVGGPGDDILEASDFTDAYGHATVSYVGSSAPVQVDLAAGVATGEGEDTLVRISHVIGSPHDDVVAGDDLSNLLLGGSGNDRLDGLGERDRLSGGAGDDIAHGGAGDDFLGDSVVNGPDGADQFYGDDGNDAFSLGTGADLIDGGAGVDGISYPPVEGLVVDLSAGVITLPGDPDDRVAAIEDVYSPGSAGDVSVTLIGDDGPNALTGGQGDDTIQGGGGDDELRGGAGDDDIDGGDGVDVANGKNGSDRCVNVEEKFSCER